MRQESGRSLIEILGVLAIAGVMAATSFAVYKNIKNRMTRITATQELKQISQNIKLLVSSASDLSYISVDYLIESGALKNNKPPIGGDDWSITPNSDGISFSINLTELSQSQCYYFTNANLDFTYKITVNDYEDDNAEHCFSSGNNQVSLFIE